MPSAGTAMVLGQAVLLSPHSPHRALLPQLAAAAVAGLAVVAAGQVVAAIAHGSPLAS